MQTSNLLGSSGESSFSFSLCHLQNKENLLLLFKYILLTQYTNNNSNMHDQQKKFDITLLTFTPPHLSGFSVFA